MRIAKSVELTEQDLVELTRWAHRPKHTRSPDTKS